MASGANKPIIFSFIILFAGAAFLLVGGQDLLKPREQVLKVYNWSDYIAEDTIAKFETESGTATICAHRGAHHLEPLFGCSRVKLKDMNVSHLQLVTLVPDEQLTATI